jgi:hypothetical protein
MHAVSGVQYWTRGCLGGGLVLRVCLVCALLQVLLAKFGRALLPTRTSDIVPQTKVRPHIDWTLSDVTLAPVWAFSQGCAQHTHKVQRESHLLPNVVYQSTVVYGWLPCLLA